MVALGPIHFVTSSASVQYRNTVVRSASILISHSTTPLSAGVAVRSTVLLLDNFLEVREPVGPECVQPDAQLACALRSCPVETAGTGSPDIEQTRLAEHRQVLRDGRPREGEVRSDRSSGQLVVPHEREDPTSGPGGEGLQHVVYVGMLVGTNVRYD